MTWQYPSYAIVLIFAAIVTLLVGVVTLRRRAIPGSLSFSLLMFAAAEWSFFRALEAMVVEMPAKIFWAKLEYLGIVGIPLLWFIFALEFSHHPQGLTPRNIALLCIAPILTLGLVTANENYGLVWSAIHPGSNPGDNLIYDHGVWFWIQFVYSYCLMAVGTLELVRDMIRFPHRYRDQIVGLLLGAALPWLGNALYIAKLSPVPGLDPTPFAFAFSGVIYAFTIFRFQLFDLVPVARDAVIEKMIDGVVVLDLQDRVIDINPAAQQLIGITAPAIGKSIESVLANQPAVLERYREPNQAQTEIYLDGDSPRYLDLRVSALYDDRQHCTGRLLVLRDLTEHKRAAAKNQALFDAIPDMVFQFRSDGTCLACNSVSRDGAVRAPNAVVGKNVDETMPLELAILTKGNIRRAIETGHAQTYEYSLMLGQYEHFFQARLELCAPKEVIAIVRDVTERWRIEAELRRINQQSQVQQEQIEDLQTMLRDQSIRDPLTGLFNRQYLEETMARELARAKRAARAVSVVAIDIDHFKSLREQFGSRAGEIIQQEVANLLRDQARLADIACRIDEEFVMILPGASADVALRRAEQWREHFENMQISFGETHLDATLSLGAAVYPFHGETSEALVRAAEQALAEAKTAGRNRVVLYKP